MIAHKGNKASRAIFLKNDLVFTTGFTKHSERQYSYAKTLFSLQAIPFVVTGKSELFQEDLYPDTLADVPAITAEEWWSGTNAEPILIPMSEAGCQSRQVSDFP